MDGRIFHIKQQLNKNLQYNWSVPKLAKLIDVSAPHLQKLFKAEMKMSPIACLRNLRLEKARELLETTFKRVSIIAIEIGINSESHFTRDFKNKYGLTPTAYRKEHWKKIQAENLR
jgi:AraC family transcriptional activator of mtrCDE